MHVSGCIPLRSCRKCMCAWCVGARSTFVPLAQVYSPQPAACASACVLLHVCAHLRRCLCCTSAHLPSGVLCEHVCPVLAGVSTPPGTLRSLAPLPSCDIPAASFLEGGGGSFGFCRASILHGVLVRVVPCPAWHWHVRALWWLCTLFDQIHLLLCRYCFWSARVKAAVWHTPCTAPLVQCCHALLSAPLSSLSVRNRALHGRMGSLLADCTHPLHVTSCFATVQSCT